MIEGLSSPRGADPIGILDMVTGAVGACVLALMQTRISWWRLSPVGFLFQPGTGLNWYIWANALVAWTIVTMVFRFGGLRLYRRVRPGFFGLFLGGTVGMLLANGIRLLLRVPGQAA